MIPWVDPDVEMVIWTSVMAVAVYLHHNPVRIRTVGYKPIVAPAGPPPSSLFVNIARLEHECEMMPHLDERVEGVCTTCHPQLQKDSAGRYLPTSPKGPGGGSPARRPIGALIDAGVITPNDIRELQDRFFMSLEEGKTIMYADDMRVEIISKPCTCNNCAYEGPGEYECLRKL